MAGFQVDMSPLVNSSMTQARASQSIGQSLGGAIGQIGQAVQRNNQQDAQQGLNDLASRAMGGDVEAFQQLMTQSPQAAQQVAGYLQQQQQGQNAQDDRFTSKMAQDTAGFIEQMHLAPIEQQEEMFNAAIDDPRYDIDEDDRASFMDTNARKAIISQVKGEDYAANFFSGGKQKLSSLQQKVAAEGLDPNTPEGQARAREITQGTRTDPSLKPSDQQVLNKANEGQLASASFATRVQSANENLTELENKSDFDPTSIQTAFFEAVPGGNLALSEDEQSYAQSKRDFITAILRKESGAAIGADEFANEDRKFFPQVGDKPSVLKQKAKGRERTFKNLKNQSKGVFDVQNKNKPKTGPLSKDEQSELQQLRAELGQ
tara:strand:+ start:469 stop:1593 length:1125 start_codon:yes stop_codon:yes gene_type:complete